MTVTRLSATDLRERRYRRRLRHFEGIALVAVAALWWFGVIRLDGAMGEAIAKERESLRNTAVLNLNEMASPEELIPLLEFLSPSERRFVAGKIWQYKVRMAKPLANVGELSKVRISASEIDAGEDLQSLRGRLERQAEKVGQEPERIELTALTPNQLQSLKPRVVVRSEKDFEHSLWLYAFFLCLAFAVVHVAWRLRGFAGDPWVLPLLFALTGCGFLQMVSIRDPLRDLMIFEEFAQGVFGGCLLLFVASLLDFQHRFWRRLSFLYLAAACLLSVLLILFGSGPGTSDAKVNLLGTQPIEAIKILLVFFLASYFCDRWEFLRELSERRTRWARFLRFVKLPQLEYIIPVIVSMALVLTFFFLQRDLGPALVMSVLFLSLYGVARGGVGIPLLGMAIAVGGFYFGYRLGFPSTVASRVTMWLDPWENSVVGGDHLAKTLWSLASGGLTGTGLGWGDAELVPAVHTDMVLASIGEEMGFFGFVAALALFFLLCFRLLRLVGRTGDHFSFFLSLGVTLSLAFQTFLIAAGVLGLLPLSGIATPFLSYGRTSMLAYLTLIGVTAAISGRARGPSASLGPLYRSTRWVVVLLVLGFAALLYKAARIQVVEADSLAVRGSLALQADGERRYQYNPRLLSIARQIPRGSILDRNGIPLATSEPAEWQSYLPTYRELGVVAEPVEGSRFYPFEGLTFHWLGDLQSQLNWGAQNNSFAERDDRVRLQGYDDGATAVRIRQPNGETSLQIRRDYRELIPLLRHRREPEHPEVQRILGRDRTLRMSLDIRFQLRVAEILRQHVRKAGVQRGVAVFVDAATGELLASVSYPWPERWPPTEAAPESLLDRARYGLYPPGSAFKLVSAIAALRLDPSLKEKTFPCVRLDGGRIGYKVRGWGKPIRDDVKSRIPHGDVDLRKGIRQSCNAYFAQLVAYEVKGPALLETAALFGIDVAQPNTAQALQDALPQAAFGQGQVTATPLEMALVAATIANGGALPQGRWVLDESNSRTREPRRVLPGIEAWMIAESMREVVTTGTAHSLSGFLPPLAGKTGTAEVRRQQSHGWFVGFAPYDGAGRVVAFSVLIENGGYGGQTAAAAAAEMVREAAHIGLLDSGESDR